MTNFFRDETGEAGFPTAGVQMSELCEQSLSEVLEFLSRQIMEPVKLPEFVATPIRNVQADGSGGTILPTQDEMICAQKLGEYEYEIASADFQLAVKYFGITGILRYIYMWIQDEIDKLDEIKDGTFVCECPATVEDDYECVCSRPEDVDDDEYVRLNQLQSELRDEGLLPHGDSNQY